MSEIAVAEVHKFGGSSLASVDVIQSIANRVGESHHAIVVSAIADTTKKLQALLDEAVCQKDYQSTLNDIASLHHNYAKQLLAAPSQFIELFDADVAQLKAILQAVALMRRYTEAIQEVVLSFGEKWSGRMVSLSLGEGAHYLDASKILVAYKHQKLSYIDWDASYDYLADALDGVHFKHLVITGFIAQDLDGHITNLGLNGSDYSAAIFAKLLQAKQLTIWTDVDGIYTADPNVVKLAYVIPELSYKEALELAYFGAKVVHPQAMQPALESGIPITIKNSFKPEFNGTAICLSPSESDKAIRGLSAINGVVLVNIEGTGMIGVSGMASRVFDALKEAGVSVLLISQASSEHSICLAVREEEAASTKAFLSERFQFELSSNLIDKITVIDECAILVAVGDAMVGKPGIAAKLLTHLAKANINVYAISQGSSERNISLVVKKKDINRGLRAVHAGFYLANRTLALGLIGPGNVGNTFLEQLKDNLSFLQKELKINIQLKAIARSKTMLLSETHIPLDTWQQHFDEHQKPLDLNALAKALANEDTPHAVVIDCSASDDIAASYPDFIKKGLHIITPNKKALSQEYQSYQDLFNTGEEHHRHFLYETTVCAGLPVINTLQDMIQTGDKIISIEGVFSGTLSYIFNELNQGRTFSSAISAAYDLGLTEPDPRDDLSGMDVARKCVCLSREIGGEVSLDDVSIESILPQALMSGTVDDFLKQKDALDALFHDRMARVIDSGQKLCYLGRIDSDGGITVGVNEVDSNSPFFSLAGTDNMVIFTSHRYKDNPLVVRGPGAGAEVTAGGVFADLIRLVSLISE